MYYGKSIGSSCYQWEKEFIMFSNTVWGNKRHFSIEAVYPSPRLFRTTRWVPLFDIANLKIIMTIWVWIYNLRLVYRELQNLYQKEWLWKERRGARLLSFLSKLCMRIYHHFAMLVVILDTKYLNARRKGNKHKNFNAAMDKISMIIERYGK